MNRGQDIMFSDDGRNWHKGKFLRACDDFNAVRIMFHGADWSVKPNQVVDCAAYQAILKDRFYEDNKLVVDGWNEALKQPKAKKSVLSKTLKMDYNAVLRILKKADFYKLIK